MFLFITSIRHPYNCFSYKRVECLLENTLRSVCNQSSFRYKVLVVCNQIPTIEIYESVEFLVVDFPPPSKLNQPQTGMKAIRMDRGCKYMAGLAYARRFDPSFIMFFDADDYISNRIVDHVDSQPEEYAWYIDRGYQYQFGDTRLSQVLNFNLHCGTSLIYPYSMLDVPAELADTPSISSIIQHSDNNFLNYILGSHRAAVSVFQSKGFAFKPLPFFGAIWTLGNGENHSGKFGSPGELPITQAIRTEFAFDPQAIPKNLPFDQNSRESQLY